MHDRLAFETDGGGVSPGREQERDRGLPEAVRDEGQHRPRSPVDPLHVVDEHQQVRLARQPEKPLVHGAADPERVRSPPLGAPHDVLLEHHRQGGRLRVGLDIGVEEVEQDGEADLRLGGATLHSYDDPARVRRRARRRRQDRRLARPRDARAP